MSDVAQLYVPGQLVIFRVGDVSYGLDIDVVEEILALKPITPTPGAPAGVLGVADVRDHVVPVFHLHVRFGVERPADSGETRLILVNVEGTSVAMLVDHVDEVLNVKREDYQQVVTPGNATAVSYLNGVVRTGSRLTLWVDHAGLVPQAARGVTAAA